MNAILRLAMSAAGWMAEQQLDRAADDPQRAQRQYLTTLLLRNKDTVFGREYGFAQIRDVVSYRRSVPIHDYEGFRPYVDRMVQGEPHILTADPPVMFTSTSGTTGRSKLLPVTAATCRDLSDVSRIWFRHCARDHRGAFHHRILTFVSPAVEGRTSGGLPVGSMSGLAYRHLPWLFRRSVVVPYEVMAITDYDLRYFIALRLALQHRVSALFAANPSTFLRLATLAEAQAEALIRAIHDGTLGVKDQGVPTGSRGDDAITLARLNVRLTPDRLRATTLESCARRRGRLLLADAWPELSLLVCWLGGSGGFQAALLPEYYGDPPIRDPGYRASEATFTVTVKDGTPAGILLLNSNFYEFIPEAAIDDSAPPVLLAHELEAHQNYYIVVTTGSGLYRYDMNDVVRVEGFYRRAPLIAFLRKGRDMASMTGEKLHTNHVLDAARAAQQETGLALIQLRVIPNLPQQRYDLLVEPALQDVGNDKLQWFLHTFEQGLCRLNIEYEQKRKSGRLLAPHAYRMQAGWSEACKRADVLAGRREVQYKWQVIAAEWDEGSRAAVEREVGLE